MKKIIITLVFLCLVSCNKKQNPIASQNLVIDEPKVKPSSEPVSPHVILSEENDADRKLNFSGKVLALRYLTNHKIKTTRVKVSSKLVKGMFFEPDLKEIIEQNPKPKIVIIEIKPKNPQRSFIRLAFYLDKKTNSCYLRSQLVQKEISIQKDPFPLKVKVDTCKKYIK